MFSYQLETQNATALARWFLLISMNENIIELTYDLVRMHTTADRPDELQRAIQYVNDYFKPIDSLVIKRYESRHKPSIVISTQDTLTPDILLVGHLDVVPATEELFEPRVAGTRVYGRGVCDMKSECAVMMRIMREIAALEEKPNIALMLTTDEEVGGFDGVNYLINEIGYRCKIALVPDGGTAPDDLVITNKGILTLRLNATGRRAHGSRPWLGENAIDSLIAAYARIRELFPNTPTAEDHWYHTCNIGTIQGGETFNQVPDFATCDLDIRFTEQTNVDDLFAAVKEKAGPDVEVINRISGSPIFTDPNHPYVKMYEEAVEKTLELKTEHNQHCGSNDGRFLSELGIPLIISRPVSGDQHSPHEWLEIESLPKFHRVYWQFIQALHESFKN